MSQSQDLGLDIGIKIRQHLSQQQLLFVKLLELNAPELDNAVNNEVESNPALEVVETAPSESPAKQDSDYPLKRYSSQNSGGDDSGWEFQPKEDNETLYEHLDAQISEKSLPLLIETAAKYIVGTLEPSGYLSRSIPSMVNDMAFGDLNLDISVEDCKKALDVVRDLEPYGVGAVDLQDCLMIQLRHLPQSPERDNAMRILEETYEAFSMRHKHRIMSALRLSKEDTDKALNLIVHLNPKPGSAFSSTLDDSANVIVPDFVISNEDGKIEIALNNRIPELRISQSFEEAMKNIQRTPKGKPKKGSEFVVTRFNDAGDFINVLKQRQQTMMNVMSAVVKIQYDYFITEDNNNLRPMKIKDITAITGLDKSVISRATTNKYVSTPWGTFPIRYFFSDSIGDSQEGADVLTNRKIEMEIKNMVDAEDKIHPLSDQKIMEKLLEKGFNVSRRTIAKYRDRIGIPVARLRKDL